jgi:hypothetical protein
MGGGAERGPLLLDQRAHGRAHRVAHLRQFAEADFFKCLFTQTMISTRHRFEPILLLPRDAEFSLFMY